MCGKKAISQYDNAVKFGISLGIPDYQLDFSPHIKELESKIDASIKYLANILVDGFLDQFKKDHPEAGDNICFSKDEKLSRKKKH